MSLPKVYLGVAAQIRKDMRTTELRTFPTPHPAENERAEDRRLLHIAVDLGDD
jgi:hypothetical protein